MGSPGAPLPPAFIRAKRGLLFSADAEPGAPASGAPGTAERACSISAAMPKRCCGALARQRMMICSTASGMLGSSARGEGTGFCACIEIVWNGLPPENGT